jgi:hypothetical protein
MWSCTGGTPAKRLRLRKFAHPFVVISQRERSDFMDNLSKKVLSWCFAPTPQISPASSLLSFYTSERSREGLYVSIDTLLANSMSLISLSGAEILSVTAMSREVLNTITHPTAERRVLTDR